MINCNHNVRMNNTKNTSPHDSVLTGTTRTVAEKEI